MSDTICSKFLEISEREKDRTAILYAKGGQWLEVTWLMYAQLVELTAAGLASLGVGRGDRVAIWANTRPEWAYADVAVLGLGAVTVPIYQSNTPEDVQFILQNSGAKVLICENASYARRFREIAGGAPAVQSVICMDPPKEDAAGVTTLAKIQELGQKELKNRPELVRESAYEVKLADTATILYTSGTTGQPKGVVLTHAQVMCEVSEAFPLLGVTARDRSLTFLPFAHILGRIEIWGHIMIGYTMAYAESIDRLKDNLAAVSPTIMIAVPRVFEKIYIGILAQAEISPWRQKVFDWAISVGKVISQHKIEKQPVPLDVAVKYQAAKRLVFDKLAERMGGQLRFAVSGGAALSRPIAEFFHAAGLLILEGYGLTETTAAVTVNTPFDYRFGSVGKPIGDVQIKIADDGEVLVKSKKVMKEYYRDPEATAAALTDGWFHTGDIGEITPEGYLRITDRKKDLLKTAGGKYVAPQRLEGLLKANRFISQVHIHGDKRKYVVALVTLNMETVARFAEEQDISFKDHEALSQNPKVRELVRQAIADANSHLASYESIKNFAILPKDFTIESGELTPSLKVKRKVVDQRYKELIDRLYGGEKTGAELG